MLARAIPFRTVCEHHLLPLSGLAHVGYLPGERIIGLSKLALPGAGRTLGLYHARDAAQMEAILALLPLAPWMGVDTTPLSPHPSDPAIIHPPSH